MFKKGIFISTLAVIFTLPFFNYAKADISNLTVTPVAGEINEITPISYTLDEDGLHSNCTGGGTIHYQDELLNVTQNQIVTDFLNLTGSQTQATNVLSIQQYSDNNNFGNGNGDTYKLIRNYSDDGGNCPNLLDISPEYTFTPFTFTLTNQTPISSNSENFIGTFPDLPYVDYGYTNFDFCIQNDQQCQNFNLVNGTNEIDTTFTDITPGVYNTIIIYLRNTNSMNPFVFIKSLDITPFTVSPPPPSSGENIIIFDGEYYSITNTGWELLNTFYQTIVFVVSSLLFLTAYSIGKSLVRR